MCYVCSIRHSILTLRSELLGIVHRYTVVVITKARRDCLKETHTSRKKTPSLIDLINPSQHQLSIHTVPLYTSTSHNKLEPLQMKVVLLFFGSPRRLCCLCKVLGT
jgi:hypothetical protein